LIYNEKLVRETGIEELKHGSKISKDT